jgi:hypothetical protein
MRRSSSLVTMGPSEFPGRLPVTDESFVED